MTAPRAFSERVQRNSPWAAGLQDLHGIIELYLRERVEVEISHGICPDCTRLWFPEQGDE